MMPRGADSTKCGLCRTFNDGIHGGTHSAGRSQCCVARARRNDSIRIETRTSFFWNGRQSALNMPRFVHELKLTMRYRRGLSTHQAFKRRSIKRLQDSLQSLDFFRVPQARVMGETRRVAEKDRGHTRRSVYRSDVIDALASAHSAALAVGST